MKDMKETGVQSREKEQETGVQSREKDTNTMKDMKETGVQSREKEHKHYERHEGDRSTEQREGAQTL